MVYQIVESPKYRVFIEAFLLACALILLGFTAGMFFENARTSKVIADSKDYELKALDLKLQNYYYQIMDSNSCDAAIKQNFIFAEDLYEDGLKLEKYEESNQITEEIFLEKKTYVLLKTELWLNTILLKEKCNSPFDTVVYIYSGEPSSSTKVAEQKIISNVLKDLKKEKGNSIVLLPIAGDLNLGAVRMLRERYNVTSLPSILINENKLIEGYVDVDELKSYLTH